MGLSRKDEDRLDELYGKYVTAMNVARKILQEIQTLEANRDTISYWG